MVVLLAVDLAPAVSDACLVTSVVAQVASAVSAHQPWPNVDRKGLVRVVLKGIVVPKRGAKVIVVRKVAMVSDAVPMLVRHVGPVVPVQVVGQKLDRHVVAVLKVAVRETVVPKRGAKAIVVRKAVIVNDAVPMLVRLVGPVVPAQVEGQKVVARVAVARKVDVVRQGRAAVTTT